MTEAGKRSLDHVQGSQCQSEDSGEMEGHGHDL